MNSWPNVIDLRIGGVRVGTLVCGSMRPSFFDTFLDLQNRVAGCIYLGEVIFKQFPPAASFPLPFKVAFSVFENVFEKK